MTQSRFFILFAPNLTLRTVTFATYLEAKSSAELLSNMHHGLPIFICESVAVVQEQLGTHTSEILPQSAGSASSPRNLERTEYHD